MNDKIAILYTNFICIQTNSYEYDIALVHISFFLAFWYVLLIISTHDEIYLRAGKNISYEKSMIAIIIGMWTRFIHWQNKLTIDYFRNVPTHLRIHTRAQTNHTVRFIPHRKMKIIHMEITSYIFIQNTFHMKYVLFSAELKKKKEKRERKMNFDRHRYVDLWAEHSVICWSRPPKNTRFLLIVISNSSDFFSSQRQYSRVGKCNLTMVYD